jgi:transposase
MSRYIGVDLHRNCFTVCARLENGRQYVSAHKLDGLGGFVSRLRPTDSVAVEVTGNTRLFYDAVRPQVKRVVVVDPRQFEVIRKSVKKTDAHDARALALFLSKDMLPEVRMKDAEHAAMASLVQTRDTLVKSRTALKNKINNLLSARGVNLSKESLASDKGLREVLGMCFGGTVDVELEVLVNQIRSLNQSIATLEKTIAEQGPKLPGHENLKSIKGIGDVGAGVLLSVIGDINDFADEGKLASYFGIVPRVSNSNETQHSGRITKRGSKLGRTVLIQCALIAKRYSAYLHQYYERIRARRGTGKAIVALARKFLGIIYRTLKDKLVWEDFANGVLLETEARR